MKHCAHEHNDGTIRCKGLECDFREDSSITDTCKWWKETTICESAAVAQMIRREDEK